jgi:hypothetical protein
MKRTISLSSLTSMMRKGLMPHKGVEIVPDTPPEPSHRGQVLIMFAGFMIALMGLLGLATDVGYAMAARRAVQGAADAGAIAGARVIARYPKMTTAQSEVNTIVSENTFGPATPVVTLCQYIDRRPGMSESEPKGSCGQTVPSDATGVQVRTRMTINTFFIQVVPGAPDSYTVSGLAAAQVQRADVAHLAAQAPFIICGDSPADVTHDPFTSAMDAKPGPQIYANRSPFRINSDAVGRIFRVHDEQLDHLQVA